MEQGERLVHGLTRINTDLGVYVIGVWVVVWGLGPGIRLGMCPIWEMVVIFLTVDFADSRGLSSTQGVPSATWQDLHRFLAWWDILFLGIED